MYQVHIICLGRNEYKVNWQAKNEQALRQAIKAIGSEGVWCDGVWHSPSDVVQVRYEEVK